MVVDTHHHFWDPARIPQPWMTAEHAVIARRYEPADLEPLLRPSGVERTVLVQSAADDRDTDYMFELVAGVEWVAAVIAWLDLGFPRRARRRLEVLRRSSKLRGVRHVIHQEGDLHWILRQAVQGGLALLEEEELLLELPAVFPDHLGDVPELARRYPNLTIVIDHLAKPPSHDGAFTSWRAQLATAAEQPNVFAKISGLDTSAGVTGLVPPIEAAVDAFGPGRLVFGSDWPVSLLRGSYESVVGTTVEAIRTVAETDTDRILCTNAIRLYRLDQPPR
jgi:L-fuconolactonase